MVSLPRFVRMVEESRLVWISMCWCTISLHIRIHVLPAWGLGGDPTVRVEIWYFKLGFRVYTNFTEKDDVNVVEFNKGC